jgi:hypothetical protein
MVIKDNVIKDFEFVDGGRKFFCTVEVPGGVGMPPWWWFRVDDETTTRFAPFEASPRDTKRSVQTRIVAYYLERLAIAARPAHQRPVWRKPEPSVPPGDTVANPTAPPAAP